jgi:hypothetical protein
MNLANGGSVKRRFYQINEILPSSPVEWVMSERGKVVVELLIANEEGEMGLIH